MESDMEIMGELPPREELPGRVLYRGGRFPLWVEPDGREYAIRDGKKSYEVFSGECACAERRTELCMACALEWEGDPGLLEEAKQQDYFSIHPKSALMTLIETGRRPPRLPTTAEQNGWIEFKLPQNVLSSQFWPPKDRIGVFYTTQFLFWSWATKEHPGEVVFREDKICIPWGLYKMMGLKGHWDIFTLGGEFPWMSRYHDPHNMIWVPGIWLSDIFVPGPPQDWEADLDFCTKLVPVLKRPLLEQGVLDGHGVPPEILVECWVHTVKLPRRHDPEWMCE